MLEASIAQDLRQELSALHMYPFHRRYQPQTHQLPMSFHPDSQHLNVFAGGLPPACQSPLGRVHKEPDVAGDLFSSCPLDISGCLSPGLVP